MKKKILITGFEPFDGDTINPSAEFLSWLKDQALEIEIVTALLPVSFNKAFFELERVIAKNNPTHIILTGFAKNRDVLTFEKIAINWVDARIADNDGFSINEEKIVQKGPDGIFTRLPIVEMKTVCEKNGVTSKISYSAGEYVCNYLFYQALLFTHLPIGFIHIAKANSDYSYQKQYASIVSLLGVL